MVFLLNYLMLSCCLSFCHMYRIIIDDSSLPRGATVFDFSNLKQICSKCHHQLEKHQIQLNHMKFPFVINKSNASIQYFSTESLPYYEIKVFHFKVVSRSSDGCVKVTVPLYVEIIPFHNKKTLKRKVLTSGHLSFNQYFDDTQVSVEIETANLHCIENRYSVLHKVSHPDMFTFPSILGCSIDISTTTASEKVLYIQQIETCNKQNIVYPSQKVTIAITLSSHKNLFPSYSGVILRKKRSASNRIYFFPSKLTYEIRENRPANSWNITVHVRDNNGPVTSGVIYGLEAKTNTLSLKMFSINKYTGTITTKRPLDREYMSNHKFFVTAVRGNEKQATSTLDIRVLDDNDNSPVFEQPEGYTKRIQENEPIKTSILRVAATDEDSGINSEISYKIVSSIPHTIPNTFSITAYGDLVVNGKVDREEHDRYHLTIEAKDGGQPRHSNRVPVTIIIEDVNDNYPQFTKRVYTAVVDENTQLNKIIVNVSAVDRDIGANGNVRYRIIGGNKKRKFLINSTSGAIRVVLPLDFEEAYRDSHGFYTLRISASDRGLPSHSNHSGLVNITVNDVNDNTPRFLNSPYHFVVREDVRIPYHMLSEHIEAFDGDHGENARISYAIVQNSANAKLPFEINKDTGYLVVNQALDFEWIKNYTFVVRASDNGQPKNYVDAEVEVNVLDANDNAPQFPPESYEVTIPENFQIGLKVISVEALDPDSQDTVGVTYKITAGDLDQKFRISTRTGDIFLVGKIDYNEKRSYKLTVQASDGTWNNSTFVYINIIDTNSHQPVFDQASYILSLPENVSIGTLVTTVHASDDDVGDNARITYCFTEDIKEFQINPQNGIINTARKLDYELQQFMILMIRAHDNGIPQKEDFAEVIIYLQDINDNPPIFNRNSYQGSILEDTKSGTNVLEIHAKDIDSGDNARIHYTFENGNNENGDFSIDWSSGMIRTAHQLDREYIPAYTLTAYAVDGGTPPLSTSVNILVNILDVDDNPPKFASDTLVYKVLETTRKGERVAYIKAVDPDEQENSIHYDLGHDPEVLALWRIDSTTGELTTKHTLDYETRQNYTITVFAYSNDFVNQVTVLILVQDCNDNDPVINNFEIIFNNYRMVNGGSFPHGVIGRVPAHDPDVSDQLKYKFINGNQGNLLLMDENTGELRLNVTLNSDRQFMTKIGIEVSDGVHKDQGICTLKVTGITEEMLQHSITVRMLHMNAYNFLSPIMYQFVDALAGILNTTSESIYVFNVQNDTDVKKEVLNVSFSARKDDRSFFTSKYLQDQIYLNRLKLVNLMKKTILPFDDNICLREPCQNYKRCTSVLTFNSTAPFVSSLSMIFRPIYPVYKLKCECPIGFTNDATCSDEVDLCYSNPCSAHGRCVSNEGGFTCHCEKGYIGIYCEIDLHKAQCSDYPDICQNGGKCSDGRKLTCRCSYLVGENETTELCGLRSRYFEHGDYLMLPGITKQWHFTLSISFATLESDGLIFYNGRLNHEHDFMALELVDGQIQLNFSAGHSWTMVDPTISKDLNDGQWHTVHIQYFNEPNPGALPQGVLNRKGPSANKIAVVTIDPDTCDNAVASNWNTTYGIYTCSKQAKQTGSKNSLDLTSPLLLGGVPDLPEAYQVHSKMFEGCLRDLTVDEVTVDLAKYIANSGSRAGCPPRRSKCGPRQCKHQASCISTWNNYKCQCKEEHRGRRCQHANDENDVVVRLDGTGCLEYPQSDFNSVFKFPWQQTVYFRTLDVNSILLYTVVGLGQKVYITLKIEDSRIVYIVETTLFTEQVTLGDTVVNDGEWHEIKAHWEYGDGKQMQVSLQLDDGIKQSYVEFSASGTFNRKTVTSLNIGGKYDEGRVVLPFRGCFQNIQLGPADGMHRVDNTKLTSLGDTRLSYNCDAGNACQPNPCPLHSTCISKWWQYECICNKGYVGEKCSSVCLLNVCQNGATCVYNSSALYGYQCMCHDSYYGRNCEHQRTDSCPPGWWGKAICAPCNCSAANNFHSICDKDSGDCKCMGNHYPVSPHKCEPCNCYHFGSTSPQCVPVTGECSCKPRVSGKQCTKCDSKAAEVGNEGCTVIYDRCPRSRYQNIEWERTDFGQRRLMRCPGTSEGFIVRMCHSELGWQEPDFSNCTSQLFHPFAVEMKSISSGNKSLTVESCIQLAADLRKALEMTSSYYERDILSSYQLLNHILHVQSTKAGFNLAAAQDSAFNDNLVFASSALLEGNESIKQFSGASAKKQHAPLLVQSWEKYSSNLLKNLRLIFYDTCICISASTMDIKLQTVTTRTNNKNGLEYANTLEDSANTVISLPKYLFETKNGNSKLNATVGNGKDNAVAVGVITYKNSNQMFPQSFENDRTFRIPEKPSVNSDVVSIQVYKNLSQSNSDQSSIVHKLDDPLVITFRLLDATAIDPQCVFWNFTAKNTGGSVGGWSQRGCTLVSNNGTHVVCHCYHLTSFAVLTDEEISSITARLPVQIAMVVGVSIALMFLLVAFTVSLFLNGVTSVQATINRHLSMALFLSNLLYLVGIQQTSNVHWCMAIAVGLHFLLMSSFAWVFVKGLHLYRVLTERRDVNHGYTRIYFVIGWIVPAIITALSVGLDAKGYGNASFCWISFNDLLIWSFAGPVLFCCIIYVLLFLMSIQVFLSSKRVDMKRKELLYEMRTSFMISPMIMGTWACAMLAVNLNSAVYFYLFSITAAVQGALIFFCHCMFNHEVRQAYRKYQLNLTQRHKKHNTTVQQLLQSSMGRTPESSMRDGVLPRYNNSTSESLSLAHTKSMRTSPLLRGGASDSEASDSYDDTSSNSSISLASSSEDEQVEINTYHNICNTRPDSQPANNHLPYFETRGNGKLPGNGFHRAIELNSSKKRLKEDSLSDGSNETSV